jgi:DNA-binding transcriptional ArsR family regulator
MSRRTPKRANTHGAPQTQRRRPSARAASTRRPRARAASRTAPNAGAASTFAALGDPTRLSLLAKLSRGKPHSISQLAHGSHLTRQAITKHLRVLERASVVRCVRSGRHSLYQLDLQPVHELRDYLDRISAEWDKALSRLKSLVEK